MNLLFHLAVNLIEYCHDYAGIDPLGEDSITDGGCLCVYRRFLVTFLGRWTGGVHMPISSGVTLANPHMQISLSCGTGDPKEWNVEKYPNKPPK